MRNVPNMILLYQEILDSKHTIDKLNNLIPKIFYDSIS